MGLISDTLLDTLMIKLKLGDKEAPIRKKNIVGTIIQTQKPGTLEHPLTKLV